MKAKKLLKKRRKIEKRLSKVAKKIKKLNVKKAKFETKLKKLTHKKVIVRKHVTNGKVKVDTNSTPVTTETKQPH
jgi:DNA repair ATPase RecN